jgi:multidrug efflux pump subunit AcrB
MNRLIQWFVENKVAANLLMVLIFVGAIMSSTKLDKEVFPTIAINYVQVSMSYPGAGPSEVEQQIVIRIEEAVADLDGVEEITARANQGFGTVTIKVMEGYDVQRLLSEIKTRVDAIDTFPGAVERPVTTQIVGRSPLMSLALHGDVEEAALKETAHWVRNELSLLPGVSHVALNGTRPYQMGIEVSEQALRRHQLTFEQIAGAIRASSLNVPAGQVRAHEGNIQIQTRNQAFNADDFGAIPVITRADGTRVLLRDVADIQDGFDEWDVFAQFNGQPAAFLELSITENPDIVASAREVRAYLDSVQLPSGVQLSIWQDASELYESRLNLLLGNALQGLLLVFIVLMLFLRPLLAMWVCVGIATAFAGAIWLLPYSGVSINMISLFAFLLVLGIVVDDAIIVGENIYSRQQQGLKGAASAASGAKMVAVPVFFAVISTMIFFAPMLAIPGPMGTITFAIPAVVILCLLFSLIECLLILPSHLAHMKPERESRFASLRRLTHARRKFASGLDWVGDHVYQRSLHHLLRHRFATLSAFAVAFALSLTLFITGWLTTSFMPQVPSDYVEARVVLPEGTPFHETRRVMRQVEGAALKLSNDPELRERAQREFIDGITTWAWGVNVYVAVNLAAAENREIASPEVSQRWRELIGDIPEAREYRLDFTINELGDDIRLNLSIADNDPKAQRDIAERISQALREYPETFNVRNSMEGERQEIDLALRPGAEMLGISLDQVARQVRQAFYGEEAQRIPRGVEDVRVMVRYPRQERDDLFHLDQMRVRTADGAQVPLLSVADISFVPGYSSIDRRDRKRNITLTAELEEGADAQAIVADLMDRHLADWRQEFPGLTLTPDGTMQDQQDFMSHLGKNFLLAVLVIYGLMAINFRSYWQPLMILTAIPFGFMGAIIGHLIMGREVSMLSMLGFVAAAGVVVNDNLVLLDRINTLRRQGMEVLEAVLQGGRDRFRAIVLTSVTTFIGLMPIMFEQSVQARFLIPMVISLSYGVLFATLVTLVLVPTLYVSADRFGQRWNAFWQRDEGELHE